MRQAGAITGWGCKEIVSLRDLELPVADQGAARADSAGRLHVACANSVPCADSQHVLEHDAERVERAVISPDRLMRQPVRSSRQVKPRLRSHPDRLVPGTRVPGRRWAPMPDTRPHRDGQRCAHCDGGRGNRCQQRQLAACRRLCGTWASANTPKREVSPLPWMGCLARPG